MLGARVGVKRSDGATSWRRVRTDGSYASSSDPRVLFGLGDDGAAVEVHIRWLDGSEEYWTGVQIDRWITLQEGSGAPAD